MSDERTDGSPSGFEPQAHRLAESRYFEDFEIGEIFILPSRTVTEAHFAAFQAISGDNHPIHYDREYCRAHGHRELLAHGLQALCYTAAGAGLFPHLVNDSLVGFVAQSCRFVAPVYVGDTVYPRLRIIALEAQRTTGVLTLASELHNQRGELTLDGEHRYVIRKRRPAPGV